MWIKIFTKFLAFVVVFEQSFVFLFFSLNSLSFWIQGSLSSGVCLAVKCVLFSFAFRYKGRLHIVLPPPMYVSFSITSNFLLH